MKCLLVPGLLDHCKHTHYTALKHWKPLATHPRRPESSTVPLLLKTYSLLWKFLGKMAHFINLNATQHVMLQGKYKLLVYYMKYYSLAYKRYHNTNNTIHQTLTQESKHCVIALLQVGNPSPLIFSILLLCQGPLLHSLPALRSFAVSTAVWYAKVIKVITGMPK